ncbi:hypothetical protein D3C87_1447550 [compost metagenome]
MRHQIDEVGADADLGADVEGLGHDARHEVRLLRQGFGRGVARGGLAMVRQAGFRQAGAPDDGGEDQDRDGDQAIDDLDRTGRAAQGLGGRGAEEDRAADHRADEDAERVERLGQVQAL